MGFRLTEAADEDCIPELASRLLRAWQGDYTAAIDNARQAERFYRATYRRAMADEARGVAEFLELHPEG